MYRVFRMAQPAVLSVRMLWMRGSLPKIGAMFYAINLDERIRPDHPLRAIRCVVDAILVKLRPRLTQSYSTLGRPCVPPEVLLKALLLQCLYSIRSERQLVERLDTDLLFRWLCGLDPAQDVFDATAFTHNRPRLDKHNITKAFFTAVRSRVISAGLVRDEHFSADGTLIESHASIKSFQPKDHAGQRRDDDHRDNNGFKPRNLEVNFRGKRPSHETHISTTDPEAKFYRTSRGHEATLCHMGHATCENRNGFVMAVEVTQASGTAECAAMVSMVDDLMEHGITPCTLGADRGDDSGPCVLELESRGVTPHIAMRAGKVGGEKGTTSPHRKNRPKVEARRRMKRRTRSVAYRLSQRARKKIEEAFSWCKTIAGLNRARHVGRWKIRQHFELAAAAFNLVKMRNLLAM
jgi:transposase